MDITPLIPAGRQIIQGYAGGAFKINGQRYDAAVLVTPEQTTPVLTITTYEDVRADDFSPLFTAGTEVLLLGCGAVARPLASPLRQALRQRGIIVETMDTGAACRTYNVLMSEGRRVAALLLPV